MRGINQDTSSFRWFRNAIFGSKYSERDQKVNSTVVESRELKKICPDNRTALSCPYKCSVTGGFKVTQVGMLLEILGKNYGNVICKTAVIP